MNQILHWHNKRFIWVAGFSIIAGLSMWYVMRNNVVYRPSADSSVSVSNNGNTITNTATATYTTEGSATTQTATSNTTSAKPSKPIVASANTAIDITKSSLHVIGERIPADGVSTYRIVVALASGDGTSIVDRKPAVVLSGGDSKTSDSILVGNEWFTTVSSTVAGDRFATVSADGKAIGVVGMTFVSPQDALIPAPAGSSSQPGVTTSNPLTLWQRIWAAIVGFFINAKDGFFYVWHNIVG